MKKSLKLFSILAIIFAALLINANFAPQLALAEGRDADFYEKIFTTKVACEQEYRTCSLISSGEHKGQYGGSRPKTIIDKTAGLFSVPAQCAMQYEDCMSNGNGVWHYPAQDGKIYKFYFKGTKKRSQNLTVYPNLDECKKYEGCHSKPYQATPSDYEYEKNSFSWKIKEVKKEDKLVYLGTSTLAKDPGSPSNLIENETPASRNGNEYLQSVIENKKNNTEDRDAEDPDDFTSKCYNAGAGAFKWIICPAFSVVKNTMETIYDWLVVGMGQINPQIFNTKSGVFEAWSIFRNIANIVFVIMFLVVIISQLTGYGINNYGIKKILPRLIVVAILVNISYFIAQLAVDVSNIIGVSLRNFLTSIISGDSSASAINVGGWANTAFAVALVAFLVAIVASPGLLMVGFLVIITGLGGLLTIFLLLLIRQVLAVIFVVAAPVIIVLYALPNTQNLFRKIRTAIMAVLLFFPLAGLVMGAAELTSRILMTISEESAASGGNLQSLYAVAALAAGTLPFFLMPALLRRSMNGIGGIGSTIGRMGSNFANKTRNSAENSRPYRSMRTALNAGGINPDGRLNWYGRFRRRFIGSNAIASAQEEHMRYQRENDHEFNNDRMRLAQMQHDEAMTRDVRTTRMATAEAQHEATMNPLLYSNELSNVRDKIRSSEVEAYSNQLTNGNFQISGNYTNSNGENQTIQSSVTDHTDTVQMSSALRAAYLTNNTSAIKAITTIMASQGMGDQINAVYSGMRNDGIDMSSVERNAARIATAQSLMGNNVKEENRDLHEWAKNNLTNTAQGTMESHALSAISKLTADSASKLDAESITRMVNAMQSRINEVGGIEHLTNQDVAYLENLKNIQKRFSDANDPASQRLRDRTKVKTQDAISTIGNLPDVPSSP